MGETGPRPDERDAAEQAERDIVAREEAAGVRYQAEEVLRQIEAKSLELKGGAVAGEQRALEEQYAERLGATLAEAVASDREKQFAEDVPRETTFLSLEQQLRPESRVEAVAADSVDERNLIAMLATCHAMGREIHEHKQQLSSTDQAIFEQASGILRGVEVERQSALKAFRRHILESNLDEATKDFQTFVDTRLGRALESVTAQEHVLERIRFTLERRRTRGRP